MLRWWWRRERMYQSVVNGEGKSGAAGYWSRFTWLLNSVCLSVLIDALIKIADFTNVSKAC